MQNLYSLFPADNFTLLAVVVALPLMGAIVNGLFGKRLGNEAVSLMALASVALSFLGSVVAFAMLHDAQQGEKAVKFVWKGWEWFTLSGGELGKLSVPIAVNFSVDALSGTMALVVTGVGFLIHLYSTGYMAGDPSYHRFFSYMNLFIFAMLVLILGDSLPVLFVGWEGVGLCSYLLIGFWFEKDVNAAAGKKAFITNRIGDFGLLVAMALLIYYTGALDWDGIEKGKESLVTPFQVWPIGSHVPAAEFLPASLDGVKEWINTPRYVNAATLVGLALFLGCAGKSAQIPLYVWLPDAMAGPTPVSALIHAATMVTAGVYLLCRMSAVMVLSPAAMIVVATIGAATAFFAATIALVQNDIKKVLAYSTVSQLGYMFLGAGVGAFAAGFFHVVTHAFFKGCLFLAAGSVIHAMHARIHDTDASQDMRNMGGMWKFMPVTGWTFLVSTAAIAGLPLTSGFFSKDEILFKSYTSSIGPPTPDGRIGGGASQIESFVWPEWYGTLLISVGVVAAVMTAFYMSRLFIRIFLGEFQGWTIVRRWKPAADDHHHHEHDPDEEFEGPEPQESPGNMTWPLIILSGLALVAGAFNAHAIFHSHWFDDFVNPVFHLAEPYVKELEGAEALATTLLAPGILAFLVGAGVAYWMFVMEKGKPAAQLAAQLPRLHQWALDKWRIDELYEETVIGAVDSLAEICVWIDKWVVDGIIARLTALVVAVSGAVLRFTQTGHVHAYAATMVFGVLGLGWFVAVPHAEAQTVANHRSGEYKLSAAPGLGYQYRWDQDGDGEWDTKEFGDQTKVQFSLARDTKRTVKLEVKNAFGRTAVEVFEIERPKEDRSAPPARIVVEHDEQGGVHGHLVGEPTQRHAAPRPRPGGRPPSDRGRRPGRGVQR